MEIRKDVLNSCLQADPDGPDGLRPGRVIGVGGGGLCTVAGAWGEILAAPAGALRRGIEAGRARPPVVGDLVELAQGRIAAVLPERSRFGRKRPGSAFGEQLLFTNADELWLVGGLDRDYNPRRLERFLALSENMQVLIVLNKADLPADPAEAERRCRAELPGTEALAVSALDGRGLAELAARLRPGLAAALVGSSGCGKTSLVNALFRAADPDWRELRVGGLRPADGRGRHTTAVRRIFAHPSGAFLMDNPGLREAQLWDGDEAAGRGVAEVAALAGGCRFADCRHRGEPGCAVQAALLAGELPQERFLHYLKLQAELEAVKRRRREDGSGSGKARR